MVSLSKFDFRGCPSDAGGNVASELQAWRNLTDCCCLLVFCRYLGFAGCIKDFDVADDPDSLFDLSKANMTGSNEMPGSCYDTAQPGLGFNGSAWARFGTRSS